MKRRIMVIRLMANLGLLSSLTVALKTAKGSRMPGLQKRFAGTLVLARSWVRPARYMPGGAHKRVLEHLPNKGRGKAGQRRSPKRESEHRGGSERGKHPHVGA